MGSREERRGTFDEVAELYDRHRPGYPDRLVDDVVWLSGIPPRGRILEIGCGTGKATEPFARRGYRMTCPPKLRWKTGSTTPAGSRPW